jgi:hypothetical protein
VTKSSNVAPDSAHSRYEHVYAVIRLDPDMLEPENRFTVVKVLRSEDDARREASRLNQLNESKGCTYTVQVTRLA